MLVPWSWLKDYVDLSGVSVDDLAGRWTLAGFEVEGIERIGGWWDRALLKVGAVVRVAPHPNADRLILAWVDDGTGTPHQVVTGAPNLLPYREAGDLERPLKIVYALEGVELFDGYQEGWVKTRLKGRPVRGIMSDAMVCSEKEIGLSEDHTGILVLPDDAPVGAALVTGTSVLVVALGGMRSDAWTDVVQGIMMVLFTAAAFALIARANGGFVAANARAFAAEPALFSRPGADGSLVPGVWIGYLLLWLFADPMFPQLFQRFMAASDRRSLVATATLYPVVTTVLFFLTVSIGVMGRASLPGLSAAQSDNVFTLLLERHVGGPLAALLLTAGMAALMSTLDSQLLSLGSMISLDFTRHRRPGLLAEKLVLVAVGAAGFLIALRPPRTILDLLTSVSFTGFAVLAPVVLGGLYWKRAGHRSAFASIVAGEALAAAAALRLVRFPGVLPVVPVLALASAVLVVGSLIERDRAPDPAFAAPPRRGTGWWALAFVVLFVLGCDFWAWGRTPVLVAGLPPWVWYYGTLGLVLSAVIGACAR